MLLLVVHLNYVVVLRVRQVSYTPFESLSGVFPDEVRVGRVGLKKVLLRVESLCILAHFILPGDLTQFCRSFPFAQEEFVGVLVALLHQLSLVGEQIVQLASTVGDDFIDCGLSGPCAWFLCLFRKKV